MCFTPKLQRERITGSVGQFISTMNRDVFEEDESELTWSFLLWIETWIKRMNTQNEYLKKKEKPEEAVLLHCLIF